MKPMAIVGRADWRRRRRGLEIRSFGLLHEERNGFGIDGIEEGAAVTRERLERASNEFGRSREEALRHEDDAMEEAEGEMGDPKQTDVGVRDDWVHGCSIYCVCMWLYLEGKK